MSSIRRSLVMLVAFCAVLAAPQLALAYAACSDTYTQDGCHVGTHCDHYDDETGEWQGSITIEYQC